MIILEPIEVRNLLILDAGISSLLSITKTKTEPLQEFPRLSFELIDHEEFNS
ncbi:hypothetical protein [Bacillus sp. OK048]|uniref:hypothetical protein n=1 Tax=Bacillus sp. OK048 TaxID=1882761 RepID=UPI00158750EB|nr:hypothetical protein [Bacillus sp. OK048]